MTIFLLALVSDRAFLLHQPPDVRARWETIYKPRHVAWQAERYLDYDAERNRSDFFLLDLWCVSASGAIRALEARILGLSTRLHVCGQPHLGSAPALRLITASARLYEFTAPAWSSKLWPWTSFSSYPQVLPGNLVTTLVLHSRSSFHFQVVLILHVRHAHRDQMLLDPTKPEQTAATTAYPLDTADEAALHPEAKTLAVLQHNGFSARLVRYRTTHVRSVPASGCVLEEIADCVSGDRM